MLPFGHIPETPWDLRFVIFNIPVRVSPWFWVAGAILGWSRDLRFVLIWLGCLFVSILVHELGHALTAWWYGWPPQIVLYHFGGLAMYSPGRGHTPWVSILISFMGPGAGFILYGAVLLLEVSMGLENLLTRPFLFYAILQMKHINLYWGLVNLLPVLPLDGGRICDEVCGLMRLRNPHQTATKIAIVTSGGVAWWFLSHGDTYAGLLFAFLCVNNIQTLQNSQRGYW